MPRADPPYPAKRAPKPNAFIERVLKRYRGLEEERRDKRNRRKPPESGLAVPVEPPRGPQPLQGGAAAPLDFDDTRA